MSVYHHAQLLFVFLVEMRFPYVGQAGLKLSTSGDPFASASQSAGITSMSHRAWPKVRLLMTVLQDPVHCTWPKVRLLLIVLQDLVSEGQTHPAEFQ